QAVNAGMGNVTLSALGNITQNAAGVDRKSTRPNSRPDEVTYDAAGNDVVNLNAMTRGSLTYADTNALTVTGVTTDIDDAIDAINANGAVNVAAGGLLTVPGAINTTVMVVDAATTEISPLSLHDALPIYQAVNAGMGNVTLSALGNITQNAAG